MPSKPHMPCRKAGCRALVQGGGYCPDHKQESGWQHTTGQASRHKRGYGSWWDKLRKVILRRDSGLCQPCKAHGRYVVATAVDHIVPKSQGGTNEQSNLQAICTPCHAHKTATERRTPK